MIPPLWENLLKTEDIKIDEKENSVKIRRITSLTASMAFILMLLTSIILYIVPQGRVAY